jgi:hypothetical protein
MEGIESKQKKGYNRKPKGTDDKKLKEKPEVKPVDVIQFIKGPFYIQF